MSEHASNDSGAENSTTLEEGFVYQVSMDDGRECTFDLTRPRETWMLLPKAASFVSSRQDWLLVIDTQVILREGEAFTVHIYEEAGTRWSWTGAPPQKVLRSAAATTRVEPDRQVGEISE